MPMPYRKYRPYDTVELPDRTWPDRVIDRAPCGARPNSYSDEAQALVTPWTLPVRGGSSTCSSASAWKISRSASPSASKTDFDFVRTLVEEDRSRRTRRSPFSRRRVPS